LGKLATADLRGGVCSWAGLTAATCASVTTMPLARAALAGSMPEEAHAIEMQQQNSTA